MRHGPLAVSLNPVCTIAIGTMQPDLGEALTWAVSFNLVSQRRIGLSQVRQGQLRRDGTTNARTILVLAGAGSAWPPEWPPRPVR